MIEKKLVEKEVEVTVTEKRLVEKEFEVTVTEKRVVELFTYEGDEYTKDDLAEKLMREATGNAEKYLIGISREEDDRTRSDRLVRFEAKRNPYHNNLSVCSTLFEDWSYEMSGGSLWRHDEMYRQLYKILHEKMVLIESLDELEKQ